MRHSFARQLLAIISVESAVFVVGTLIVACTTFACLYAAANATPLTVPLEESEDRGHQHVGARMEALSQEGDDFWQILLSAESEGPYYEDTMLAERSRDGREY